ncbi:MAG TPA: DUF192 domain-containing protein [Anaerolineae bacterium]|nr:DUF192 domain-containing protein [Anaerolineae bacterium]
MTVPKASHCRWRRRSLLLLALTAALVILWLQSPQLYLPGFGALGSDDFVQYWSAGRLLIQGGDPYDPDALLDVQRMARSSREAAVRMWNPPWTLALFIPFALLPFGLAALAWMLLQLALILTCGLVLWRYFAPGDGRFWVGPLLAALFVPGLISLRVGQSSGWLLAGIVVFLIAQRSRRDVLAGAGLALLAVKPHVTYLFWLSAVWWALRFRRGRVLAGGAAALAVGSGLAAILSPAVFRSYLEAAAAPPMDWAPPTIGAWLRLTVGLEHAWVQFLPTCLCAAGLLAWLLRRRGPWRWEQAAAPLLLVSVATAAYGWTFDQVVLLPVVVDLVSRLPAASRARRYGLVAALALVELVLLLYHRWQPNLFFDVWHPVVLGVLYWWSVAPRRPARIAPATVSILNLTRGRTLVSAGWVADSFFKSLRGLIGHKPLGAGEGLVIVPSNSIHTHFMGFAIDVLYVDREQRVVGVDVEMAPWRVGRIHRGARFVIELPAGAIAASGTQAGDQLRVEGYQF